MGKKDEKQRQELVAAIESGRYKNSQNAAMVASIVFISIFLFINVTTIFIANIAGDGVRVSMLLLLTVFMFFLIIIIAISYAATRGSNISRLSSLQRWLILNGEKIEADLDAIDQRGSLFVISCSAEYVGQKLQFVSPAISVRPIPFEERKITVFINPQNPQQYLINVYEHLPLMGDNKLHDRSEMQVDINKKNPNQSTTTLLLVICLIFFVPFALFGFFAGIGAIMRGDTAVGVVMMTMCPSITGLALYGIFVMSKKNKSISENGYYIPATAQRFWVTRSKNGTYYHLSARYIEPSTKQVHEFQTTGPKAMEELVGTKVNTFINPNNTREYFMDVQGALRRLGFTTSKETGK